MIFLRHLGWIDTWALSASLFRKERRAAIKAAEQSRLVVRDGQRQHPDIGKNGTWTAMRNAIIKANRLLVENFPQWEIGSVAVEELAAGAWLPWEKAEGTDWIVHVGVVSNPGAMIFAGNEGLPLVAGQVVAHGRDVLHSAVNVGLVPRLNLTLTIRRREVDVGDER